MSVTLTCGSFYCVISVILWFKCIGCLWWLVFLKESNPWYVLVLRTQKIGWLKKSCVVKGDEYCQYHWYRFWKSRCSLLRVAVLICLSDLSQPMIVFYVLKISIQRSWFWRVYTSGFFVFSSCSSKITYCVTGPYNNIVGETRHFNRICCYGKDANADTELFEAVSIGSRETYTQSFRVGSLWKEHHNTGIGCNPFSGRLTHLTRQMREHNTVSPNYRHLST